MDDWKGGRNKITTLTIFLNFVIEDKIHLSPHQVHYVRPDDLEQAGTVIAAPESVF